MSLHLSVLAGASDRLYIVPIVLAEHQIAETFASVLAGAAHRLYCFLVSKQYSVEHLGQISGT
jgi:hypothetical protein